MEQIRLRSLKRVLGLLQVQVDYAADFDSWERVTSFVTWHYFLICYGNLRSFQLLKVWHVYALSAHGWRILMDFRIRILQTVLINLIEAGEFKAST